MGRAERFDRRLENLVGNTFARMFGGNVVTQEVAIALERESEENVRELAGGRQLAPNHYIVSLGTADHERMAGDEQRVTQVLAKAVAEHLAAEGLDTYGDVVVSLERNEALHTGQFKTRSSVDPDARPAGAGSPRSARPSNAGDPAMSQPPATANTTRVTRTASRASTATDSRVASSPGTTRVTASSRAATSRAATVSSLGRWL